MYGARKGCTINDVSAPTQLLLEVARLLGVPAAAIALDKEKCFDRLLFHIVYGLHAAAGCPEKIITARASFMEVACRRFKLRGYFSQPWNFTNGSFQGDPFLR